MANRLYVSFWDLCLDNLPQGRFECRVIGAGDASQVIRAAHTDKTLLCVIKDDLLAPYGTKKRRRHEELCAVLRASYDCLLVASMPGGRPRRGGGAQRGVITTCPS